MNRLQYETSPYLRQHADNPVDWYPWGDEAFERARAEDKAVLLSVGYSSCHWCHVMAHESFENAETARMMNDLFINIKVDREERPDVDDIYMQAVQALTGGGGWPMTVFLTPDGRPFYGGTYYPPVARQGMPSFRQILAGIHDAYANRRDEVERAAESITQSLGRDVLNIGGDEGALNAALLDEATEGIAKNFDGTHGGFGGAPKFPQPMVLEFMLRSFARTGDRRNLAAVAQTLVKMARGGIYDQIGGGFARYSTDAMWLVPHFEKMLYDNAQLSRVYLHMWQITGDKFFREIAEEVYDYILREMTSPEGGFYSATDADSEGEEGRFFVWTESELRELLGEDADIAIEYWGVTPRGNFEGMSILFVPNDKPVVAARLGLTVDQLNEKIASMRDVLFAARSQRVPPGLDDKILTGWNGLMLASLAEAARVLDREDYRIATLRSAEFLTSQLMVDGRLKRTYKDGQAKIDAYLEDYATLAEALLEVYRTTHEDRWFVQARGLVDHALQHFRADDGGFFDTSDEAAELIVRPRNVQDNAIPAGNSVMAKNLVRLAAYTGESTYDETARNMLGLLTEALRQFPQAFAEALNAVDMLVVGLAEVAIVGDPEADATRALLDVVQKPYRPNVITALARENVDGEDVIPLLNYRMKRAGAPTVYVCRNFACQMPVTTPDAVADLLKGQAAP
jgi:uncharacterized protein YyaL (SSP411 family)